MALRLVMVSMVAGLGLTLPTTEQLSDWKDSAGRWVGGKLAEWDARMPAGERAFLFVNEPDPISVPVPEVPVAEVVGSVPVASPQDAPRVEESPLGVIVPPEPADDPASVLVEEMVAPAVVEVASADASFDTAMAEVLADFQSDHALRAESEASSAVRVQARNEPNEDGKAVAARVVRAVDLTREAILAWARLLHAPATVAIAE